MKGTIQIAAILVLVIVLCAGSVTFAEDSECCIDCRQICCKGGVPPSLTCFIICAQKCPDYAQCGGCNSPSNLIGMYDPFRILYM